LSGRAGRHPRIISRGPGSSSRWSSSGSRDATSRARARAAIVSARDATFAWARPFLPARFDAAAFIRTLLEVSYRAEVRPEDERRIDVLMEPRPASCCRSTTDCSPLGWRAAG